MFFSTSNMCVRTPELQWVITAARVPNFRGRAHRRGPPTGLAAEP